MSDLRRRALRLASELPKGSEARRQLLGALRREALSQVAKTIVDQMGGVGRLRAMLGMGKLPFVFSDIPRGVQFMWPSRRRSKGNLVRITLRPDDAYDVEFVNASIRGHKPVKTYNMVYADQLVDLFERQTGLFLRLGSGRGKEAAYNLKREMERVWEHVRDLKDAGIQEVVEQAKGVLRRGRIPVESSWSGHSQIWLIIRSDLSSKREVEDQVDHLLGGPWEAKPAGPGKWEVSTFFEPFRY
jgi:hypothetical protein